MAKEKKRRKPLKYWKFAIKMRWKQLSVDAKRVVKLPSFRVPFEVIVLFQLLYFGFSDGTKLNLFGLANQAAGVEVLSIIATSLAAIFSIALAFIVLAIENAKSLFAWHTYKRIFSIEWMRELDLHCSSCGG